MAKRQVVVSLGSNLGNSAATLKAAAQTIAALPGVELSRLSNIYTSMPAIVTDQPVFKNAIALLEVSCEPKELLSALQNIESEFGRVREGEGYLPYGPRTLDLDIIDFEGVVSSDPVLTLPHPEALKRAFVVTPLLEICPHYVLADQKVVNNKLINCGELLDREGDAALSGNNKTGCLFICATPIGNLADITLRVLETLRSVEVVYCEDTRVTRKLATRYEIKAPLRRADAHQLPRIIPAIINELKEGKRLAYVSDAGMPGISDPGSLLVSAVREAGYPLEVLPGASALTTALATSGIKAHNHFFGGYFPRKSGAAKRLLEEAGALQDTALVFYESIHRVAKTVQLIAEVFPTRTVTIARELTKLHEEVISDVAERLAVSVAERVEGGRPFKGEVVLLVSPPAKRP